jgi:hypothetical protein
VDGLLLRGRVTSPEPTLMAYDGDEGFEMEALEALYYEVVAATADELLRLEQRGYRLLRRAPDFKYLPR